MALQHPSPWIKRGVGLVVTLWVCSCAPGELVASQNPRDHQGEDGRSKDAYDLSCPSVPAGHVAARRLTNEEYANSVRALLYLDASVNPTGAFPADSASLASFDNEAKLLQMSTERAELLLRAAVDLSSRAMGAPKAKWLTCNLASAGRACAVETLTRMATRAYRRPVTDAELAALLKVYDASAASGAEPALQRALQAILVSSRFLYLAVGTAGDAKTGTHVLDNYELASRLSYFLWRSMPDDALFNAAAKGELTSTSGLRAQVERMLYDPRSALITGFAQQWLALNDVANANVDATLYPDFNEAVRRDLAKETQTFVNHIVANRRPLRELFLADYSFMNERVARHYGRTDVTGESFQKVALPADGSRLGLITHASVLALSAGSPIRTAPTTRGHWVLEKLLCSAPPAAPVGVPKLGERPGTQAGTLKEKMAAHRADPGCAVCHQLMDPVGMGLESFDVVGRWRTQYNDGSTVDPSGAFPDATVFAGPGQMLQHMGQGEEASSCVTKKLMAFALGRQVTLQDACTARAIAEVAFAPGKDMADLIMGVALTRQFQQNEQEVTP